MLVRNEDQRVQLVSIQVDPWKQFNKNDYNGKTHTVQDIKLKSLNKLINAESSKQIVGSQIKNCQLITRNIHG